MLLLFVGSWESKPLLYRRNAKNDRTVTERNRNERGGDMRGRDRVYVCMWVCVGVYVEKTSNEKREKETARHKKGGQTERNK